MCRNVHQFVRQCPTCQQVKYKPKRPAGLLQPLPIPASLWEDLSLDFITGLPSSQGHTTILGVVDRFSKRTHLDVLPSNYTAPKVATLFLNMVCKLHGFPRSLVFDRDPIFIGRFWWELFTIVGTKLRMSTSYHPETNGQTKVLNRTLEQFLRCFVLNCPSKWFSYLPLAEWCYNTSIHSATRVTPFDATYGKAPLSLTTCISGSSLVEIVDHFVEAKLHDKSTMIQRCFDDNNDDNKR